MPIDPNPENYARRPTQAPRVLSSAELESFAGLIHFADAARTRVSTADFRAIDAIAGTALAFWVKHPLRPLAPSALYEGSLIHRPVDSDMGRRFSPEAHWQGWSEPIRFDIQGVKVDSWSFIFLHGGSVAEPIPGWRPSPGPLRSIWGILDGTLKLVGRRELPLEETGRLNPESIETLLIDVERSQISDAAKPAPPSFERNRL